GTAPPSWDSDSWRRPCRPSSLEHVHDIRGTGGIGKQDVLQRVCPDATAHGYSKDVDHLFGMRPKEMGAEDALAPFFDDDLESRRGLAHVQRAKPLRGVFPVDATLQPLGARSGFGEPHGRERGHRKDDAGASRIIRLSLI